MMKKRRVFIESSKPDALGEYVGARVTYGGRLKRVYLISLFL
jgi:hypothetical protein